MRNILTRKFSRATPSKGWALPRLRRDERGQGILEYVLVLMVVLGMVFVLAKPVILRLQSTFEKGIKGSIFKEDPTGSNFYYFPIKNPH